MKTDYSFDPDSDLRLNARDEIALRAPMPAFVFQPSVIAQLAGINPNVDFDTSRHLPIALARWQILYADAYIQARSEISDSTLRKEFP